MQFWSAQLRAYFRVAEFFDLEGSKYHNVADCNQEKWEANRDSVR